jgi:nucleoside-diphosphate-sugar epimerase
MDDAEEGFEEDMDDAEEGFEEDMDDAEEGFENLKEGAKSRKKKKSKSQKRKEYRSFRRFKNGFIDGFITRAFSHTGPRRGFNFSISSDAFQIAKMVLGLQNKVLRVGNLNTERVVIDVRDCVNAYYLLMMNENSTGKVFNVCGSDVHKMQYFTDKLIEASGIPYGDIEQKIDEKLYRPIDIQVQIGDSSDLVNLTDWKPEYTLEQTMNDLLNYWIKKLS